MADFNRLDQEKYMSNDAQHEQDSDGVADSIAATAIITVVVFGLYLWLSGMPS